MRELATTKHAGAAPRVNMTICAEDASRVQSLLDIGFDVMYPIKTGPGAPAALGLCTLPPVERS